MTLSLHGPITCTPMPVQQRCSIRLPVGKAQRIAYCFALLAIFDTLQSHAVDTRAVVALLDEKCSSCHDGQGHPLDTMDRDILVGAREGDRDRFIEPGHPENSYLWTLIDADVMPKSDEPLSEDEKSLVKQWIIEGAPFPDFGDGERVFVSELDVLRAIEDHLNRLQEEDRDFIRYFTLHILSNDRQLPSEKLRLAVAALAKSLNSLSRNPELIHLEAIDEQNTVFAIDLRDLGWDKSNFSKWQTILKAYPYGFKPIRGEIQRTFKAIQDLYESHGFFDGFAYVRADWFVSEAMRPPLYHTLLGIPETFVQLQNDEGFNRKADFLSNRILRGGVLLSNVSSQPRMIDFHEASRSVWVSSDFLSQPPNDPERGDIVRFPLGPIFAENPHHGAAFEHAGSEIIFTLPNGLHGYMLVDDVGNRIDAGPIDIVADRSMVSGTPEIVNGVSCISCHRHGMVDFKDQIRDGHSQLNQREIAKIDAIFRSDAMQQRIRIEREAYLKVLREVIGPCLQIGKDADQPIESFPEPITAIVRMFQRDLSADRLAAELGIPDVSFLSRTIENQTDLLSLGLGVIPKGGTLKRKHWEARGRNARESIFQRVSKKFGFVPVSRLSVN